MPLFALSIVVQVIAVVHVLRTGRPMWWIMLIVFLPAVGCLAYFFVEVLPSWRQSPTARRALQAARAKVDPGRGVREGALDYERSQNIETATRLAEELTKAGQFDEAIRVCNEARTGFFEDDPKILLALANAQFAAARYADAIGTLDYLRDKNPGLRAADGHLIYARALEESGAAERALKEYDALAGYYPGAEARVRQGMLLKKLGRTADAQAVFAAILKDARLAPKHFRKSQREWIALAEKEKG
jgi:hypothetical protein